MADAAMRPGAMRAGLWEFPSLLPDKGASTAERAAALDAYLARLVACWGALGICGARLGTTAVLEDANAGELVHVFSHIRMTIRVRRLVVAVPVRSPCACRSLRSIVMSGCARLDHRYMGLRHGGRRRAASASLFCISDASWLAMLHMMVGKYLACLWGAACIQPSIHSCCGCKGAHHSASVCSIMSL